METRPTENCMLQWLANGADLEHLTSLGSRKTGACNKLAQSVIQQVFHSLHVQRLQPATLVVVVDCKTI